MAALLVSAAVHASCGTAVCSANTDWNAQRVWNESGAKFDLRYEFIDQDQPRSGSKKVDVGAIPRHDDEVRTLNRNWIGTVDYAFDTAWGISAALPIFDRTHDHIHNHRGAKFPEHWNFTEIGDLRVLGRYQFPHKAFSDHTVGVNLGLKLPTGKIDIQNDDGDVAERTLQPGTGTTDLLVGAYYSWLPVASENNWFAQALLQAPLNTHDNFKPGQQLSIDVGLRRPLSERASALLQLNTLVKRRDRGSEAEPENTGSTSVSFTPGLSYSVTSKVQVYGFVQLPVYQHVNGVQLTPDWAAVVGLSSRF